MCFVPKIDFSPCAALSPPYRGVDADFAALRGIWGNGTIPSLGISIWQLTAELVGLSRRPSEVHWLKTTTNLPYSFFLRVTGFVKTVSKMRLRRRFLLLAGASPSLVLFDARGAGSAGLGRGEISSTSAMGSGFRTALDLTTDGEGKKDERFISVWEVMQNIF